ncbi:MAG: formyltetrahydrofolate deformylase [Woeseiaceae bacterium]|nr:formyltetrahydrofolate deformylase [Woeseiaceae bacterium]
MAEDPRYFIKISCKNQPGIVAAVSSCIAANNGDILEAAQFDDTETGQFLMRVYFATSSVERVEFELKPIVERFSMRVEMIPESRVGRALIMVSKEDHCLHDLLYRWRKQSLKMEVVGIVSNHRDTEELAESYGVPFHYLPVTKDSKSEQERKLLKIVLEQRVDLVILARYMQILSDDLANRLYGKIINIHHSFLPSFKGAKPYHQAHCRGVKLMGATAHYVTPDLDEGPIIEQEVARVKHSDTVEDLVRLGQDTEAHVLARAVRWHLEHRVLMNGNKTVVFT